MKVLTALRDQASMMRKSRADAHLGVAAGKWEIFFDEKLDGLKREESEQLELQSIVDHRDEEPRQAQGGRR